MCVQEDEQVDQDNDKRISWPLHCDLLHAQMNNSEKDSSFGVSNGHISVADSFPLESICEDAEITEKKQNLINFVPSLRSGEWSDIGGRPYMEDTHICIGDLAKKFGYNVVCDETISFYGVFDGHGGKSAAQFVRDRLPRVIVEDSDFPLELEKVVTRSFLETDSEFAKTCSAESSLSSGTTALTAIIFGRSLLVANAGDCRAVLSRAGGAIEMSKDHRPLCMKERMRIESLGGFVDDGYLNGQLGVTRALGNWHLEGMKEMSGRGGPLSAEPELKLMTLTKDDEFLIIGSDGIWDVFRSQNAVDFARRRLQQHNDVKQCCKEIVGEAIKRGATDNLTVVMVCFQSDPPPPMNIERPNRVRRSISAEGLQNLKCLLEVESDAVNSMYLHISSSIWYSAGKTNPNRTSLLTPLRSMDSLLVAPFPNSYSYSITNTSRNLWRSKAYANNNNYCSIPSSCASKASRQKWNIQKEYNVLKFWKPSLSLDCKGTAGGSTHQECNRKFVVKAAPEQSFESEKPDFDPKNFLDAVKISLDAFYRFSRPHTVIGTALSILSVSLLAVEKLSDISPLFFTGVLEAVVAALFMNIYIVGLNQLSDVEIDKINKPYLPLASGEYSFATGAIIVASSAILSLWLGWIVGSGPLLCALFISFVLGTAYSINVPLLRWKRFAVLAAMCILSVRAVIVQLAFFLHMQTFVYKRPVFFSKPLIFATAFMSFFSVVIALFKDIPDIEGDQIFGIQSFSVRLGQKPVFWICVCLLELAYGVALVVGATSSSLWSKIVTGLGHAVLASLLYYHAKSVDLKSKASITSFYMFIWKLFYAEYLLIPLVR